MLPARTPPSPTVDHTTDADDGSPVKAIRKEIDELEGVEVGPGSVVGSEALEGAVGVGWSLVGGLGSSHLGLAASS